MPVAGSLPRTTTSPRCSVEFFMSVRSATGVRGRSVASAWATTTDRFPMTISARAASPLPIVPTALPIDSLNSVFTGRPSDFSRWAASWE